VQPAAQESVNPLSLAVTKNISANKTSVLSNEESALPQLAQSVSRMADILETLQQPLLAYLHDILAPHEPDEHFNQSIEKLLAESPVAALLADETINDVLINGPFEIYVGRESGLEKTNITFPNKKALSAFAEAIAHSVGRTIDPRRPLVDARLKDGSRVNIIAPPMSVSGLAISIRKFPKHEITVENLLAKGEVTSQMATFLKLCVQCHVSLLISGGTGTGKTTLLNAISRFIPENERIITIEDTAELRLQQPHVVTLETKEPHTFGERQEEVNASDLLRNTLRMRPDRIIVGEVRNIEAYDMIQALNTGHNGSMTTIHANTPRDAITRLENLIAPRMQNTPALQIRRQIVSAFNLVIQLFTDTQGRRLISSITEIVGMEGETPTMQEIFALKEDIGSTSGNIQYRQTWTGIIPHHPKLAEMMHSDNIFIPSKAVE